MHRGASRIFALRSIAGAAVAAARRACGRGLRLLVPLGLLALAVGVAVTLLLAGGGSREPVGATNFDTGTLQGTVYWNGTPITGLVTQTNYRPCVQIGLSQSSTTQIDTSTGHYTISGVGVGTYTPKLAIDCVY